MLPPLRFRAIYKARAWGPPPEHSALARLGKRGLPAARTGESWELADLPDEIESGQSSVEGGPFDGRTLRALRISSRDDLLGVATPAPDGGFPLLVKFLDAAENLSIQVHPDEAYVRAHPGAHLKTEAWIVLEAKPGARVYRGLRPSTTPAMLRQAIDQGRVLEHLESFAVGPGDCVYLPSGICHALGAGILAAEIQTPSDTTFRVWDWSRDDPRRPLHVEQAFECMRFGAAQDDGHAPLVRSGEAPTLVAAGVVTRRLCRTGYFAIESLESTADAEIPVEPTGVPEVWMTLDGSCLWTTAGGELAAPRGTTVLRPAAIEPGIVRLARGTRVLRATCGSPLDGAT